jgi:hypothetical protein
VTRPKHRVLSFATAAPDAHLRHGNASPELRRLMDRPQAPIVPQRHQPAARHVPGSIAYEVLGGRVVR